jgi:hypothetical protein
LHDFPKPGPSVASAELKQALFAFTDLGGMAHLWTGAFPNAKHELVAEFRELRRPFVVSEPYRCFFECPVCGVQTGDAMYHYEDPRQPVDGSTNEPLSVLGPVAGRYVQVEYSVLHGIIAHGQPMPPALALIFAEARRLAAVPG